MAATIACPACARPLNLRQVLLLTPFATIRCRGCGQTSVPDRLRLALSTPMFALAIGVPALVAREIARDSGSVMLSVLWPVVPVAGLVLYVASMRHWVRLHAKAPRDAKESSRPS